METALWLALRALFVASFLAVGFFHGATHIALAATAVISLQVVSRLNRRLRTRSS